MKKLTLFASAWTAVCWLAGVQALYSGVTVTTPDFGQTQTELREVTTFEVCKPPIPDEQVGDVQADPDADPNDSPPNIAPNVGRPLYLVLRYYSCVPWLRTHVRKVFTNVGQTFDEASQVQIDELTPEAQIVQDVRHPAYGLYCLRIVICVPWDAWPTAAFRRVYVKWARHAPYWCWVDHWWYYWRTPCVRFDLSSRFVQTPNYQSDGIGDGRMCYNPAGNNVHYTIRFRNLIPQIPGTTDPSGVTVAHFHDTGTGGVIANGTIDTSGVVGQQEGLLTGIIPVDVPHADLINKLQAGEVYVNIHSDAFPGGEIRGNVPALDGSIKRIWCPFRPSWIPCVRWTRAGQIWGLTICHPYCYRWTPHYYRRPFCLYGLQHYFTPIGDDVRNLNNSGDVNDNTAIPVQSTQTFASVTGPRTFDIYNSVSVGGNVLRPIYKYWPYTPYCARWYWYRCAPFHLYRYNPPIVKFAVWLPQEEPDQDQFDELPPITQDFPDVATTALPGTRVCVITRPVVSPVGDVDGNGVVGLSDIASIREQFNAQGVDSFFDTIDE